MKNILSFYSLFVVVAYFNCENCVLALDRNSNHDFYIAGVVEYVNKDIEREKSPAQYLQSNVQAYLNFIDLAKEKNVDIIVFPEATFNYFSSRSRITEYAFLLPDPSEKIAPWERDDYSEYIKALSKKCNENQIYALINLVEKVPCSMSNACKNPKKTHKDGYDIFNTNVVFDRQGRVISKYRKYNLFIEPLIDQPLTPEHSTFVTDFGVKFGHFICFDILFQEPAINLIQQENITNVLYPSMWFSDMPFLASVQTHQGWAYANNVNLISSGASNPRLGSSGSGIFIGHHLIAQSFISPYKTQRLITATVPKDPRTFSVQQLQQLEQQLQHHYEQQQKQQKLEEQTKFTPVQMQDFHMSESWAEEEVQTKNILNEPQSICINNNDICCDFDIKMKMKNIPVGKVAYKYKLAVNYTTRIFGLNRKCGEVYCSIVACTNDESNSCGRRFKDNTNLYDAIEFENVAITAKIKYNNPSDLLVIPNTLDTSILPLDTSEYKFSFVKDELGKRESFREYKMQTQGKIKNILAFGIYGRNFALDEILPKKPQITY